VLINLGMPTKPTSAIQQEGRIYRIGQMTDAIIRYFNTGTSWERIAFAEKVSRRADAAESLGQGEAARGLFDAFVQAFEAADTFPPGHSDEGKGGKENDRALRGLGGASEYDRAKSYYFGQTKTDLAHQEPGGDRALPTPEPIGLKMMQWAMMRGGEAMLEPSAGHGALARWMPDNTVRTAIEPSYELAAKLALAFDGKIENGSFEDHHIVDEYDGIVMNPPYNRPGSHGSALAFEHITKAWGHLREGGRLIALFPEGPACRQTAGRIRGRKPAFAHDRNRPYDSRARRPRADGQPAGCDLRARRHQCAHAHAWCGRRARPTPCPTRATSTCRPSTRSPTCLMRWRMSPSIRGRRRKAEDTVSHSPQPGAAPPVAAPQSGSAPAPQCDPRPGLDVVRAKTHPDRPDHVPDPAD
jgi:hypothetical protein